MNLKSITKSAAKLAVGAALTTGASTAMADGWFYADGAITDSNGIRCPVSANGSLLTVNSGTSFSGVTDIDFSKPIVDGAGNAYAIGAIADAAFYSSAVTSIRLPDTITTIGGFAFQFCTAITNITPFLPSSVTQIGIKAFNGATNLRGELTIGVSGTDFSFGGEQVFDSASSVTSLVLDGTLASMPSAEFYNCTSLEKVVIGEGTQVIGTFAFQMCTVLKSVEFKGYSNWAADSSFKTIPDYQVLFEVPSGDVQWKTFLENAGNVTPWDGLGPDVQQKFYDVHGAATNDPVPYGLVSPSVGGGSTQWIAYKRASGSKYHLQVVGERDGQPFDVGVLSPAYGSFENDVLPTPCRCEVLETNVCGETALYECYGHEFAQFDGGTAVDVRTNLSLTCQFAPEAGGSYRVKWLWRTVGYKLTIAYPNELGEVTVDGESEEYYRVGLPVTVTATGKNGATFVRWFGDVPAGADKSASLELVMDEARTICPYFRKNWQLVGSTMSDGYWTLNVVVTTDSNGQDGVSVSGVSSRVDYLKFLDLAKAIDADGEVRLVLIGLGNAAFYAQDIVEVTLPETLTTIGGFAFQNCGALEKVTPLLPPSVSSIGLAAFENCAKLIGTAMLGARKRTLVLADRVFSSASLLEGLVIRGDCATLPSTFAYSCTSLKRIETPSEMTQLGDFAFQFCTGVKTLTFRSRPQWEEKTFDGWADFGTIVYVPSNDKCWQSVLGDKELVTPWRDLTDEMRQTFTDGHAGARRPKGLMQPTLGLGRQWIDVTPSPGFMLLLY